MSLHTFDFLSQHPKEGDDANLHESSFVYCHTLAGGSLVFKPEFEYVTLSFYHFWQNSVCTDKSKRRQFLAGNLTTWLHKEEEAMKVLSVFFFMLIAMVFYHARL